MELSDGYRHVTPYQLCALCHQLVARYSENMFWNLNSYECEDGKVRLKPTLGVLLEPLAHHDNLASLQKSAAEGCHLCTLYAHANLSHVRRSDGQGRLYVRVRGFRDHRGPVLLLGMYEKCSSAKRKTNHISMAQMRRNLCTTQPRMDPCPTDSPEARYKWCTTTDCDESYEMISHWLQQCINNHGSCRRRMDDVRPTRLLDLNAMLNEQDIRLVLTEDVGKQSYATLSYRWGEGANVRLKTYNYEEFRTRIALKSLPRTIQEAVKVCRRLRVRYFWVDALCIIQEDGEDLAREIARMGSIYAGSLITVAAGDSTDCESGCFRERHPLQKHNCIVSHTYQDFVFSRGVSCSLRLHYQKINKSKLNERGWVYQERVLSPRTVHFTADEIIWECRERCHCHDCAQPVSITADFRPYPAKTAFSKLHDDLSLSSIRDASFRMIWSRILFDYTGTNLSSADDRLCALAGIARLAHDKVQSQASYGIWLGNFLEDLLWSKSSIHELPLTRNTGVVDLAPSWSWASKRYQVSSLHYVSTQRALYSAIVMKYPPATPFAQLTQLSSKTSEPTPIRLYGWLRSCHIMPFQGQWVLVPTTGNRRKEVETYIAAAWKALEKHKGNSVSAPSFAIYREERREAQAIIDYTPFSPDEEPRQRKNLFCVLLKRIIENPISARGKPYAASFQFGFRVHDYGIVCESVDLSKRLFRRVGYLDERMCVGSSIQVPDKRSKSDILKHLGYYRQRDGTLGVTSSLSVDAPTATRILGLTSDEIQDQVHSPKEVVPEYLLQVDGGLSLFKDGYEEAEIEII